MTPNFAAAVDPVFLQVLGLLERISANQNPVPAEERTVIKNCLRNDTAGPTRSFKFYSLTPQSYY